jgi:hypothetical protein
MSKFATATSIFVDASSTGAWVTVDWARSHRYATLLVENAMIAARPKSKNGR